MDRTRSVSGAVLACVIAVAAIAWFAAPTTRHGSANPWSHDYDPTLDNGVVGSTTPPPPVRVQQGSSISRRSNGFLCLDYSTICSPRSALRMSNRAGFPSQLSVADQRALREQAEAGLFWKYNPIGKFLSSLGASFSNQVDEVTEQAKPANGPQSASGSAAGMSGSGGGQLSDEEAGRERARNSEKARAILDRYKAQANSGNEDE